MRVLFLSDVYFPRINGVCTALQTYRSQLSRWGIDTHLLAPDYGQECDETSITRLSSRPAPFDPEDRFVRPSIFRKAAMDLAKDFDLIHIHTPFSAHGAGLAAAKRFDLPVLNTYHTLFEEYLHHYARFIPRSAGRALARHVSRRQCNQMDAVIVPSAAMAGRLGEYGVKRPLHILPTGIPLDRFGGGNRQAFRHAQGLPEDRPAALFLGRLGHEKNLRFLLEAHSHALKTCPELLLILAGEGPAEADLKETAKLLGILDSVRFLGNMDRQIALPDCLAGVDFFAFASLTETQGLVLLEAMASGLPVVALAEMGTKDILKPESGAQVPEGTPEDFGRAMAQVAQDKALREQMAQASRCWAAGWSDDRLTQRLADLYRSVQGHPRTP